MRRSFQILALSFLVFMVILCLGPDLLLLPMTLAFGWINALRRLVVVLSASPGAVAWAGAGLLVLLGGTQWLCSWLWRTPGAGTGSERDPPRWRWRWTLQLQAALAAVLLAAMSLVGVAHQTGWLIASREPIYVSKLRHIRARGDVYELGRAISEAGAGQHWDAAAMERQVWTSLSDRDLRERLGAVFLTDSTGRLVHALILPRHPEALARVGVGVVEPDTPFRIGPAATLTNALLLHYAAARAARPTP